MVTGVRIESHQVMGAQGRMARDDVPLPGGNESARARLGSVVRALCNDSGQLRSGYLRLAANQDGSFQMRAGHSLLGKSDQARARDYVLQTIKDAYGDVPGMDQAISRYLSSGQAGGKLGTVSTLKLIQSLEEMRLKTTGQNEGQSELLEQAKGIAVDPGKTGRLDTDFTATAQASWKVSEHLSQGWAKLAPQVSELHLDINQALRQPRFSTDAVDSVKQKVLTLVEAHQALMPPNLKGTDLAIQQAWLKTPEGRQMSYAIRAIEWKVSLFSLVNAQADWKGRFEALKPGEDHSALRQEASQCLSTARTLFGHSENWGQSDELTLMEKHLDGSRKLNDQLTSVLFDHISFMAAGLKYLDNLPKPRRKDVADAQAQAARQEFMALLAKMNAKLNPSAGTEVKIKDVPAFERASIKQTAAQPPESIMELGSGQGGEKTIDNQIENLFFTQALFRELRFGDDDSDASSSRSSIT